MTASGAAQAFNIDTGNPDLSIRLDNSVRYNLGVRTEGRNAKIANNPNFDESDARFDRGDIVTNRLDLLSELDITYKRNFGLRVSGAAWYDHAYRDTSVRSSPAVAAQGYQSSYDGDRYSSHTKRYHRGPSGEILDAFVFANFDVGEVPVNFKAGRHTIYWGESLLTAAHGIAYSQQPVDFLKALNNPGSEVKELYKPLGQISAQLGLTDTLWVAGQYYLEWDPFPFPEGGTYLGLMDGLLEGPTRLSLAPGFSVPHSKDLKPKDRGNWGGDGALEPGLARRHARLLLPQVRREDSLADAGWQSGRSGQPALPLELRPGCGTVRHQPEQGNRRRQRRRGSVLPQERRLQQRGRLLRGGCARQLAARGDQRDGPDRPDAAVRHRIVPGRIHLCALGQGHQEPRAVQRHGLCPVCRQEQDRRLHHQGLLRHRHQLHPDLVPGAAIARSEDADDLLGGPEGQRRQPCRRLPGAG
ncbi:hypothetical protein C666_11250 [Thauera linaloolentis 47Lol = DSM 12138]|uniref:Uncharacterized protein n=1 Tax=Thauera linaloolentis (strain DSM 12138 / JCM 21573 / CCUG 41526 / CIP 105981 / IAM 15112 / NBRC 102519 / 47Lol) TaxID=1123367 RepID=N6Y734_THAL4|nr:hypothetical protein C666_11250 [Thauera linaloolentis 47Lol = DSM 12138]